MCNVNNSNKKHAMNIYSHKQTGNEKHTQKKKKRKMKLTQMFSVFHLQLNSLKKNVSLHTKKTWNQMRKHVSLKFKKKTCNENTFI